VLVNDAPAAPGTDTLGGYIGATRRAVDGLTQEKLAGRIGVSVSTIRQWEQNQRIPDPRGMNALHRELPALEPQRLLALAAAAADARHETPPGPR
jgi:transcriptional regulator with XRE-family HTH domain